MYGELHDGPQFLRQVLQHRAVLRNVLERAAILCEGAGIDTTHLDLESCVTFAVRRRTTATQEDRAFAGHKLASDLRPSTPKHRVRGRERRDQQARRVNNIANLGKSAKPPSPVQSRAAPPILNR